MLDIEVYLTQGYLTLKINTHGTVFNEGKCPHYVIEFQNVMFDHSAQIDIVRYSCEMLAVGL